MKKTISILCALSLAAVMCVSALAATDGNATSGNNIIKDEPLQETPVTDSLLQVTPTEIVTKPVETQALLSKITNEVNAANSRTKLAIMNSLVEFYNKVSDATYAAANSITLNPVVTQVAQVEQLNVKGLAFNAKQGETVGLAVNASDNSVVTKASDYEKSFVLDFEMKINGAVAQPTAPIVVEMSVPADMHFNAGTQSFVVEHFVNGPNAAPEVIIPKLTTDSNGTIMAISFPVTHFSYFRINGGTMKPVVAPIPDPAPAANPVKDTASGANTVGMPIAIAVAAILAGGALVYGKKNK
ncbi:MAG: hypothetical protein RR576_05805 [Oscillospiraceae bacterium]